MKTRGTYRPDRSPEYHEVFVLQIVIFTFNQWVKDCHNNCACILLSQYIGVKHIFFCGCTENLPHPKALKEGVIIFTTVCLYYGSVLGPHKYFTFFHLHTFFCKFYTLICKVYTLICKIYTFLNDYYFSGLLLSCQHKIIY